LVTSNLYFFENIPNGGAQYETAPKERFQKQNIANPYCYHHPWCYFVVIILANQLKARITYLGGFASESTTQTFAK